MKLVIFFFFVGTMVAIIIALVRIRKNTFKHDKDTFECTVCDENNCDCHKIDEK